MRTDLEQGEFWADRVKELKDKPDKRLALALKNLPLPAAFRESAVALRAQIRAKRKRNTAIDEDLALLYWLAAARSLMVDFAPRLQEPGFNVMEAIPGNRICSLDISYSTLGYRELSLLNRTDVKWLVNAWGEPNAHTTLHAMYRELWDEYETRLIAQRKEQKREIYADLMAERRKQSSTKKGCGMAVVLGVAAIGIGLWWISG